MANASPNFWSSGAVSPRRTTHGCRRQPVHFGRSEGVVASVPVGKSRVDSAWPRPALTSVCAATDAPSPTARLPFCSPFGCSSLRFGCWSEWHVSRSPSIPRLLFGADNILRFVCDIKATAHRPAARTVTKEGTGLNYASHRWKSNCHNEGGGIWPAGCFVRDVLACPPSAERNGSAVELGESVQ